MNDLTAKLASIGELRGSIGAGSMILNDYTLTVTDIEGGHRLTITRGSQTQIMDVMDGDNFTLDDFLASDVYAQIASAEQGRAVAEAAREQNETERSTAESERKSAEIERKTAETARRSNETNRENAEIQRENAEQQRVLDESERNAAEANRASAEQTRQSNEAARRSAETERNEYYTGIKEQVEAGAFDGETPIRGTDYWTEADQEAIVQQVIAALGTPVFGRVDENNNIILTGELADGEYTVKYEDAEGNATEIGTIDLGGPSVFDVPLTWIIGTKLSKTTGEVESTTSTEYNASEFVDLVDGASYVVATTNDCYNAMNVVYYDDNNAFVGYQEYLWSANQCAPEDGQPQSAALVIPSGATRIRLRQYESANNHGWSTELVTLTGTVE